MHNVKYNMNKKQEALNMLIIKLACNINRYFAKDENSYGIEIENVLVELHDI